MKISIDFETRSALVIWEVGAWAYSCDPSTEILCMAYAIDEGPVKIVPRGIFEFSGTLPEDFMAAINAGAELHAFNAFFEQSIWKNIMIRTMGVPNLPIPRWRCTQAKALARALPRNLEDCGTALNAPIIKSATGKKIMLKLCKPRPSGGWYEDEADLKALYEYCKTDVEAERCIDKILPDLVPEEQNIWFHDQLINQRGVYVDLVATRKAIELTDHFTKSLRGIVADVTGGLLDGTSRRNAVMGWCRDKGVSIDGYAKEDVAEVLSRPDLPAEVRAVLEARVQGGKTSVAKYQAISASAGADQRVRDLLMYCGAGNTGRWAGKLIQIQNLPKGSYKDISKIIDCLLDCTPDEFSMFYTDVMVALSSAIRGMFISAPGHDLLVCDYAAIEARVIMWLANEVAGIKMFTEFDKGIGEEPYVTMAKLIYPGRDIGKKSAERALGKTAILGCGFGMGADKFLATCDQWGVACDQSLAKVAVDSYRNRFRSVKKFWYAIENAAIATVTDRTSRTCGRVRWLMDGGDLLCELPSGRRVTYNRVRLARVDTPWGEPKLALHYWSLVQRKGGTTKVWAESSTYGGKLAENVTQAVARDLLAWAQLRLERRGYPIVMSIHDEAVCEMPEGKGSIEEMKKIMCASPKWAEGIPVAAEGFRTKRYKKG